jgi:hypothetical protein
MILVSQLPYIYHEDTILFISPSSLLEVYFETSVDPPHHLWCASKTSHPFSWRKQHLKTPSSDTFQGGEHT